MSQENKRKLVKNGRAVTINIPPALLEMIKSKVGDDVNITFNADTKKIEISPEQTEAF